MIISCVFLAAFCEAGFSTPIQASESVPARTHTTSNAMEYAPFWALQWRSLPEHEQNFWMILVFLVPNLITIVIYLLQYCYLRWVSYRKDEKKQVPSYPMLLQAGENLVREFGIALASMQKLEERRGQFHNDVKLMNILKVEDERHYQFQNEIDLMKKMTKVDYESHAQFQNEMVSVKKKMKEEDKRRARLLNEVDSMKAIMKAEQNRRAVLQNKGEWMKRLRMNLEEGHRAQDQKERDSMKKMAVEYKHPSHYQNKMDSVKRITKAKNDRAAPSRNATDSVKIMEVECENLAHSQSEVDLVKTTEVEGKHLSHSQNEVDSAKIMKVESKHLSHSQNEVDSVKIIKKVEDESPAHLQDELDSVKIMMLKEEIVGDPTSVESHVGMGRPRKYCLAATKVTDEKENVSVSKKQVVMRPLPNIKAVKPKVVTWRNSNYRPSESSVKISNQKLDFRKIKAKVDTWRKVQVQEEGDRMEARYDSVAGKVNKCGSITQPRLNKSRPTIAGRFI
jgi:hypothetical protein